MLAFLLAATTVATDADFAFLAGNWRQCSENAVVEERWLGPRGGLVIGANLTVRNGQASYEHMRIARDAEGWTYWVSPAGKPPVPFKLIELQPNRAVFANPDRGFPARIIYARNGDVLDARIEGTVEGRQREASWRFAAGNGTDCDKR